MAKELQHLTDDQLDIVTGGTGEAEKSRYEGTFTGHVGQYDGVIGQQYYVVYDDSTLWFRGELIDSWERTRSKCFNTTDRKHKFRVTEKGSTTFTGEVEVYGGEVTLYTTLK